MCLVWSKEASNHNCAFQFTKCGYFSWLYRLLFVVFTFLNAFSKLCFLGCEHALLERKQWCLMDLRNAKLNTIDRVSSQQNLLKAWLYKNKLWLSRGVAITFHVHIHSCPRNPFKVQLFKDLCSTESTQKASAKLLLLQQPSLLP